MTMRTILALVVMLSGLGLPFARAEGKLEVARINLYLVWEGTGKLSSNLASEPHIQTVSDQGDSASQFLIDVVVEGDAGGLYEDSSSLEVEVLRPHGGDGALMEKKSIPITYIQETGKLYTTLVVEHGCERFDVVAWIQRGKKRGAETLKEVYLDCGD